MSGTKRTLVIAKEEEHIVLRLVSALVLSWDQVPLATQGLLISDASLMLDGPSDAVSLPKAILTFINLHKGGPLATTI
jgi:hypothetical protein